MLDVFAYVVIGFSLALAAWSLVLVIRNQGIDDILLFGSGFLELLLVIQLVVGLILLAGLDRSIESATFIGYLIGCIVLPPLAVIWSLSERTRWGSAVLLATYLVMAVLIVRLLQIWSPVV